MDDEAAAKQAPASFRAGALLGRNLDTVGGLGGLLPGAVGGALAGGLIEDSLVGTRTPLRGIGLGTAAGAGLGYLGGRAAGRFSQGLVSGQAHAYPVKEASLAPAKPGFRRTVELLTGSRARGLERQVASRRGTAARHIGNSDRILKDGVFGDVPGAKAEKVWSSNVHHTRDAQRSADRAARSAGRERSLVSATRREALRDTGKLGLGAAAGTAAVAGVDALTKDKTASSVVNDLASTVAAGSKTMRKNVEAVQKQVVKSNNPTSRKGLALLGGGGLVGAGVTASATHDKKASITPEREQQIKEAFGAALMQGLKGVANFAQTAGKSIFNAGTTGGVQAAGQAAANAGRAGLQRAGNFISQNPGAGAALVAAPAMAAGYAAGRQ